MKLLSVDKRKLPFSKAEAKFRVARIEDGEVLLGKESVTLLVDGSPEVVFVVLPEMPRDLLSACRKIQYQESTRTDGLVTRSRVFGSLPRVTLRRDFCTMASLAEDQPSEHKVLCSYAARAAHSFEHFAPERWHRQLASVTRILPEWRLPGGVFTSGIVNYNNVLRYHRDSGNFNDVWSAMYVLENEVRGGELVIPELNVRFSFGRPSVIMFDGANFLHGVTPIDTRPLGYRYSIVFYAMKHLCNCLTMKEELARIRKVKSRREVDRAAGKKVFV